MAVQSVGSPKFIIDSSQSRKIECQRLRDCLGDVVATTIQRIAEQTEYAVSNYERDNTCLNKAVWYPIPYIRACMKINQLGRLTFMQEKGHLGSGYLSSKHFTPLIANDERIHWTWLMKPNAIPSEAIREARCGLSILDCGTVCTIAQYTALLEVLGEEKFNRLFSEAVGELMVIDYKDHELQPMRYFVSFTEAANSRNEDSEGNRKIERGQIVSFNNHPSYQETHTFGMDGNYNVCCLVPTPGQQTFVAHGLSSKGLSEREIRIFLANTCNENLSEDAALRMPKHLRIGAQLMIPLDSLRNKVLRKKEGVVSEKNIPGLDRFSYQDFNIGLIYDLIKAPLEKVTMEFVRNHPEAKASVVDIRELQLMKSLGINGLLT